MNFNPVDNDICNEQEQEILNWSEESLINTAPTRLAYTIRYSTTVRDWVIAITLAQYLLE